MKPIHFKESEEKLKRTHKVIIRGKEVEQTIYYLQDGDGTKITVFKSVSFWERLKFLFHGKIWVGVLFDSQLPSMWVDCKETVFKK